MAEPVIRAMDAAELGWALDRAADEGWNPGLHDGACFHAADPGGFFVALADARPVGCISAVAYGHGHGFIGFYIVEPASRGRGHGLALWRRAMDRLGDRNIGLDGVLAQQPNYRRSGFRLAWRNIRFEGRGIAAPTPSAQLVAVDKVRFEDLAAYDRRFFPADRTSFLRCWTAMPGARGVVHVVGGAIGGYGIIRPCRSGYKIGPLFADTAAVAEDLLGALAGPCERAAPVYLDVPECNPPALAMAERHAMTRVFETARMYTGEPPPVDVAGIYGITTFELG